MVLHRSDVMTDDGRKNSSESSCYAYIYCHFYVFTQLYKSLKYHSDIFGIVFRAPPQLIDSFIKLRSH